jgi:enoyl-CoA hydratase/carnithine racemase
VTAIAQKKLRTLDLSEYGGVLVVTLNRPPANAMNRELIGDLATLFGEIAEKPDAPAVVLTGNGDRFFSAGGDIKELDGVRADEIGARMRAFHALLVAMDRYPRPIVTAVNGHCIGGGVEVALFSDIVLSVCTARFGFPEINHGLLPADKGLQRANRILGVRATRRIVLSGELFDAQHALEMGLVDEVVTDQEALARAALAAAGAAGSKVGVLYAALKRSVNANDEAEDEVSLRRTLSAAESYFDDPAARALRLRWSDRKKPSAQEKPCLT